MHGVYSCRLFLNKFFRFFKFGYIRGENILSLRASISRSLKLSLGEKVLVEKYARLTCRGDGVIEIGDKSYIGPYVLLETQRGGFIKIGSNTRIDTFCVIYGAGGVTIGNDCLIACHTVIVAGNHNFSDITKKINTQGLTAKGITIGDDVWIGTGVSILDGVHIGSHTVIGAGSVVTKDIPDNSIAVGVPAKVIKTRA